MILSYEDQDKDLEGRMHFFNHSQPGGYYVMGVTLAAGYSLDWLKKTVAPGENFELFLSAVCDVPAGAGGLLFTPYLVGERTPHADSVIRGSFFGLDGSHRREHLIRAVMEGILALKWARSSPSEVKSLEFVIPTIPDKAKTSLEGLKFSIELAKQAGALKGDMPLEKIEDESFYAK